MIEYSLEVFFNDVNSGENKSCEEGQTFARRWEREDAESELQHFEGLHIQNPRRDEVIRKTFDCENLQIELLDAFLFALGNPSLQGDPRDIVMVGIDVDVEALDFGSPVELKNTVHCVGEFHWFKSKLLDELPPEVESPSKAPRVFESRRQAAGLDTLIDGEESKNVMNNVVVQFYRTNTRDGVFVAAGARARAGSGHRIRIGVVASPESFERWERGAIDNFLSFDDVCLVGHFFWNTMSERAISSFRKEGEIKIQWL